MTVTDSLPIGLSWKLRRVGAGLRLQDVSYKTGIATTRLSSIERGEQEPTDLDRQLIEGCLPELKIHTKRIVES